MGCVGEVLVLVGDERERVVRKRKSWGSSVRSVESGSGRGREGESSSRSAILGGLWSVSWEWFGEMVLVGTCQVGAVSGECQALLESYCYDHLSLTLFTNNELIVRSYIRSSTKCQKFD